MVDPGVVVGVYTPEEVEDMRPTVRAEPQSLLSSAPAAPAPPPAIEPEVLPPEAVDAPAKPEAVESEVVPPAKTPHEELKALLTEIGGDSVEWLIAKKWIREDQPTDELPAEKVKELLAKKSQFKQAVKTFKELQLQKKEKKNV